MKQIELGNLDVTITANDTTFVVEIGTECFAETYMDQKPYRWPNPADNGRLWGYIKGPANVRIPAPGYGHHELALLIGGRLFQHAHDFPDPNAEPEQPKQEELTIEEPAEPEPEPTASEQPEPEQPAPVPTGEPEEGEKVTITLPKKTVLDMVTGFKALTEALTNWVEE